MRGECTDPGSKEICGCGVFLDQSDSRGNMCRQLVQSYQCTAARRATLHTHPHLQRERKEANCIWSVKVHQDHCLEINIAVITQEHYQSLLPPPYTHKVPHPQLGSDQYSFGSPQAALFDMEKSEKHTRKQ